MNDHFRFPITGQNSRILTIKIPFWERFKIFPDPLLDEDREKRFKILKAEIEKNDDALKNCFFLALYIKIMFSIFNVFLRFDNCSET